MNRAIITSLLSIVSAQGLKIVVHKKKSGKWDWRPMFQTGGMPSSHSAGVSSIAAYTALKHGVKSTDFALAVVFGLIVMYDAQGIRRHTGEIAKIVNELNENIGALSNLHPTFSYMKNEEALNELLGHQPIEVLGGAILGIGMGTVSWLLNEK
ncbi:divergent PAP2 family protein [Bacillus taeanensis]